MAGLRSKATLSAREQKFIVLTRHIGAANFSSLKLKRQITPNEQKVEAVSIASRAISRFCRGLVDLEAEGFFVFFNAASGGSILPRRFSRLESF